MSVLFNWVKRLQYAFCRLGLLLSISIQIYYLNISIFVFWKWTQVYYIC